MRARYYSPDMKRFINADIVAGAISNAITLNRFAYANGNPVSFVDPFGLWSLKGAWNGFTNWVGDTASAVKDWTVDTYNDTKEIVVNTYKDVKDWTEENIVEPMITIANNVEFDMQNFDWNNDDEEKVLESNYFSAYKGKLVLRFGVNNRSGSFGILFIDHSEDNRPDRKQTIQHEYGHTKQLDELGIIDYLLYIR